MKNEKKEFKVTLFVDELSTEMLKNSGRTFHMKDRATREALAKELEGEPEIAQKFLVDRGHRDGCEIHVVTKGGLIYIYNNMKLFLGRNALITILIARPNQVKKLYKACNIPVDEDILKKCIYYQKQGYNNM